MFTRSIKFAAALALGLSASTASAATFTYGLFDHPDGTATAYEYGLRLDYVSKIFSFENGASATLVYDDAAGTATISGTMRQSFSDGTFGALWDIIYTMTGLTNTGAGTFEDTAGNGTGSISMGGTSHALGAKSAGGKYFILEDDDHRLGGHGFPAGTVVGRGWVDPASGLGGANDFLFTAELDPGDPGTVVPLPAAGWMLLTGLIGLGAAARRRRG